MTENDRWLLNLKDAGALLSVSRATMERLVQQGAIPTVKVLGCTRITRHDLMAYVATLSSSGFTAAQVAMSNQRASMWAGTGNGALIPSPHWTSSRKKGTRSTRSVTQSHGAGIPASTRPTLREEA